MYQIADHCECMKLMPLGSPLERISQFGSGLLYQYVSFWMFEFEPFLEDPSPSQGSNPNVLWQLLLRDLWAVPLRYPVRNHGFSKSSLSELCTFQPGRSFLQLLERMSLHLGLSLPALQRQLGLTIVMVHQMCGRRTASRSSTYWSLWPRYPEDDADLITGV